MAPRAGQMTDEHKAALAEGRAQGRAVRAYLEALETHKPKRGRKRTPDSMRARLGVIDATIDDADPMARLQMVQERIDLTAALEAAEQVVDGDTLHEMLAPAVLLRDGSSAVGSPWEEKFSGGVWVKSKQGAPAFVAASSMHRLTTHAEQGSRHSWLLSALHKVPSDMQVSCPATAAACPSWSRSSSACSARRWSRS